MKKNYTLLFLLLTALFTQAQNYNFSLQFVGTAGTGNHQFALIATPDFEQIVSAPTADMGVAFYIPSGYTLGNFVTGNSNLQFYEWQNTNENSYDGDLTDLVQFTRSDIVANNFTHAANQPIELVLFEIISDSGDGNNPTTGQIILAENNDPNLIANFYESFININIQDGNGTQDYFGVHTPGNNAISFATLSVSQNTLETVSISVYPNPTNGIINISTEKPIDTIEVFNLLGAKVKTVKNINTIDLSNQSEGMYLLKITIEGQIITKKVMLK